LQLLTFIPELYAKITRVHGCAARRAQEEKKFSSDGTGAKQTRWRALPPGEYSDGPVFPSDHLLLSVPLTLTFAPAQQQGAE